MPKSQIRLKRMDMRGRSFSGNGTVELGLTRRSILLSSRPRKVSFEGSRNDSTPSICSDDTVLTSNGIKKPMNERVEREPGKIAPIRKKRSLLVRPITSLSLVDLAKPVTYDNANPTTYEQSEPDQIQAKKSKRVCSFNLSPRSVIETTEVSDKKQQREWLQSYDGASMPMRPSLWGHFIDMAQDDDDYDNILIAANPNYSNRPRSKQRKIKSSLCKDGLFRSNRRSSPYGEYKIYMSRGVHPTLSFIELKCDFKSNGNFRLTPRKKDKCHDSPDGLIDIFSELQVQHFRQNQM